MNHSFIAAKWNQSVCQKCARPFSEHSITTCESCGNTGDCELSLIGNILMCQSCQLLEKQVVLAKSSMNDLIPTNSTNTTFDSVNSVDSNNSSTRLTTDQLINQVNRLVETDQIRSVNGDSIHSMIQDAIHGNIKQYTDFFNAKIASIIEMKQLIDNDNSVAREQKQYELARQLRMRVQYLSKVLFQFQHGQLEVAGEIKSIQSYINDSNNFRKEIRDGFAISNPNFIPQPIKSNVPKETKPKAKKQTIEDKLAEGYAKRMNVSIERARLFVAGKLREQCTCSTTPGICSVHH